MNFVNKMKSYLSEPSEKNNDVINIGTWGSCCTRDVFNSKFIPNYKDKYKIIVDQQHISVISMMSSPVHLKTKNLEGNVSPFFKKVFKQDMKKDFFKRIEEAQPEYLLIDFYTDVRYGAAMLDNGKYITNKLWQYKKLSAYKEINVVK